MYKEDATKCFFCIGAEFGYNRSAKIEFNLVGRKIYSFAIFSIDLAISSIITPNAPRHSSSRSSLENLTRASLSNSRAFRSSSSTLVFLREYDILLETQKDRKKQQLNTQWKDLHARSIYSETLPKLKLSLILLTSKSICRIFAQEVFDVKPGNLFNNTSVSSLNFAENSR